MARISQADVAQSGIQGGGVRLRRKVRRENAPLKSTDDFERSDLLTS
jgi:hypothetical protein